MVNELKSFTLAAGRLGYTQSTVSFQIKQLEKELSIPLFERIGHTVTLTNEGEKLLPLAQQMQEEAVYRYNGMFMSVWQLLAQARSTTQAVVTATEAQRDFWLAETDLRLALTGTSPGTAPTVNTSAAPAASNEAGH